MRLLRLSLLGVGTLLVGTAACNLVIGIDSYRSCADSTCSDGSASDVLVDTNPSDAGCSADDAGRSVGCTTAAPVCSHGSCVSIVSLAKGASSSHSCALLSDKRIRCWGANESMQLGNGTTDAVPFPVEVSGIANAVDVAVGNDFTCALLATGGVECWGDGADGELANGGTSSGTPTPIALTSGASAISAGMRSACAIVNGKVFCWGDGQFGQLGCPPGADAGLDYASPAPLQPDLQGGAQYLGVGQDISCFVTDAGVTCYGDNFPGMGDGRYIPSSVCITSDDGGVQTDLGSPISADRIYAAPSYACAEWITFGRAFCWGDNGQGQILGHHTQGVDDVIVWATLIPIASNLGNVAAHSMVSPGVSHACAVVNPGDGGVVECWGASDRDQLGGANGPSPQVLPLHDVADLAAHRDFTCALRKDGQVLCWGAGRPSIFEALDYFTLGNGDTSDQATPTPVVW